MHATAGICFFFEENDIDVWSGRRIDLDAWNYAIKAAGDINEVVIVNKTDIELSSFDINVKFNVVRDMPSFDDAVTVVCPWESTEMQNIPVWNFDHDVRWYIFGPAAGWQKTVAGSVINVPQANSAALHSVHIASIILTHRYWVLKWL